MSSSADASELISTLLKTAEHRIVPLAQKGVASGSKVFGASILSRDTNNERASPLLHGEINSWNPYSECKARREGKKSGAENFQCWEVTKHRGDSGDTAYNVELSTSAAKKRGAGISSSKHDRLANNKPSKLSPNLNTAQTASCRRLATYPHRPRAPAPAREPNPIPTRGSNMTPVPPETPDRHGDVLYTFGKRSSKALI
ncbi:cytidine/deoxycytidylate deaminase family protein [Metarhizium rileyi]|uniref:Cytidine/deoxycytidylate deaminase family protein n=1 Tax=Metarhizium rileyi (strain RCEF 4871) TaxID=1649241 RepID=A0A162M4R2_METRR|nr:cytidine/deoxycytidylate deaminase family protein [Metarhizium rileyi RCEF 4871]